MSYKVMNLQEVNTLNGKRSLTGGLKGISHTEYLSLKKTAEKVDTVELRERNLNEREQKITIREEHILAEESDIALKRSEMALKSLGCESRVQDLLTEENAIQRRIACLNAEYQKIRKSRDIFRNDLLKMSEKHDEERYFYYETSNVEINNMILRELKDKKIVFNFHKYTGNETIYKFKIPKSECFWTDEIFEKAKELEIENENRFQGFSR